MLTLKQAYSETEQELRLANTPLPRLETNALLSHLLSLQPHHFYTKESLPLSASQYHHLKKMIDLKKKNMPTAYITGSKEFFGRGFHVNENVLIPRPETEELVEWVLENSQSPQSLLDLGCGSGCIGTTLSLEMSLKEVVFSDINEEALKITQRNAKELLQISGVRASFLKSDLFSSPRLQSKKFDLIVSNPPYVLPEEMSSLMLCVREYEPDIALKVPSPDFMKKLIEGAFSHLKKGGCFYIENHPLLISKIRKEMLAAGFQGVEIRKDLSGKNRFIYGFKTANECRICF